MGADAGRDVEEEKESASTEATVHSSTMLAENSSLRLKIEQLQKDMVRQDRRFVADFAQAEKNITKVLQAKLVCHYVCVYAKP